MNGNDLVIQNTISDLILKQGEAYQINSAGQRIDMTWQPTYAINGNYVNINVGEYNASLPLIIELDKGVAGSSGVMQVENLLWSTFYGSYYNDIVRSNTINGNQYWVTGHTSSSDIYIEIAGPGSYLTFRSVFVSKFDLEEARLLWATHISGNNDDQGMDVDFNPDNNHVFVVGWTKSSDLIQSSSFGYNDMILNGNFDGFVYEIDEEGGSDGNLLRSYIGGSSNGEGCNSVAYEKYKGTSVSPRLIIAGSGDYLDANDGFPIVPSPNTGAFNLSEPAGIWDGYIIQFNESMNIEWSTYFGSTDEDHITDMEVTPNAVYITGSTGGALTTINCDVPADGGFPICDGDGLFTTEVAPIGNQSGFVAQFKNDNVLVWSTHIPNTFSATTKISVIEDDGERDVYVAGNTQESAFMTFQSQSPGSYNLDNDIGTYGFIARYTNNQLVWRSKLLGVEGSVLALQAYHGPNGKGVIVGGSAILLDGSLNYSDDCSLPVVSEFPYCNSLSDYYTEENNSTLLGFGRMWFTLFNANDNIRWSTFYGTNSKNSFHDFKFNNDKLLTVGYGNFYTLEEFDIDSDLDYYKPVITPNFEGKVDGLLSMFDMSDILLNISESELLDGLQPFTISPNPFNELLNIFINERLKDDVNVLIYNEIGQVIYQSTIIKGSRFHSVDAKSWSKGIYIVSISIEGESVFSNKIIKQ